MYTHAQTLTHAAATRMPSPDPLLLAAAPNGAYKTRRDHPALPLTPAQLAADAAAAHATGARMLHLHVRDANGNHTLAAAAYRDAIDAIRETCGEKLFIQATSESAGVYAAAAQRDAMRALTTARIDGISIALRELFRAPQDETPAAELIAHLHREKILIQYILYSRADISRYQNLRAEKILPRDAHTLLLVLGKNENGDARKTLHAMHEQLHAEAPPPNWMACAFGADEFAVLCEAAKLGGHVRVGFENSLQLKTGKPAADNRELITQFTRAGNPQNRPLANTTQTRRIMSGAQCV